MMNNTLQSQQWLLFLLLLVSWASLPAQEVFRWVDSKGQLHFGDQPRRGAERMAIRDNHIWTGRVVAVPDGDTLHLADGSKVRLIGINAPEVAILGVSRSRMQPVWDGQEFKPRLMLPLSLSYDHRVIDGAAAARFVRFLGTRLEDLRRLTL